MNTIMFIVNVIVAVVLCAVAIGTVGVPTAEAIIGITIAAAIAIVGMLSMEQVYQKRRRND